MVAAEARYHQKCFRKLHNPGTGEKKGRPQNKNINAAMENVFSYIENHEDCQFTLSELKQTLTDYNQTIKLLKQNSKKNILIESLSLLKYLDLLLFLSEILIIIVF